MFRRTTLVALTAAAIGLSQAPAASAAIATASFDWSQFTLSVLAIPGQPAPAWSFLQQAGSANANTFTVNDSSDTHNRTSFNWTTPATVDSDTPHGHATSNSSSTALSALATSSASQASASSFYPSNYASAQASRTATLALQAPAAVVITVPYAVQAAGPMFDFDDYTTARVSANASFQPALGFSSSNASRSFELDSRYWFSPQQLNGTLIFGLVADGAGTMTLSLDASAQSFSRDAIPAVPEPATGLQVIAGLAIIGAIALRRGRRWYDDAHRLAGHSRGSATVTA